MVNVLIGLAKMKLAAALLGPTGVGLIALYQSLIATAAQVGGLGVANASLRQVAQALAKNDAAAVAVLRRTLFAVTAVLATLGALLVWVLSETIARDVLHGGARPGDITWIAIAIGLTIVASSQQYLLNGYRRIGDLARLSITSSLIGAMLGITALLLWGKRGVIAYVVAIPVAAVVAGAWYTSLLGRVRGMPSSPGVLVAQARLMLAFGITMMLGNLAAPLAQLIVRGVVGTKLGAISLGEYAAASSIALTYIGFILAAMGADYYPRLAAVINDKLAAVGMVNQQAEMGLLLGAPLFLAMQSTAPWVIQLLYSSEFTGATDVLRLMVLADILKLLGWPLGFVLLAGGRGRTFFLTETLFAAIFVGVTLLALPHQGLLAAGTGILVMYLMYLPIMALLARRSIGFYWQPRLIWTAITVTVAMVLVGLASMHSDRLALAFGAPVTVGFGLYSLYRLSHLAEVGSPVARLTEEIIKRFRRG